MVVPITITVWIFWWLFNFFDHWFRELTRQYGFYESMQSKGYHIPEYGVGFALTIALITLVGFVAQLYIGRKLIDVVDYIFLNIPGVSTIYNGVKQVSHSIIGKRERLFEAVGLIEFPRKGIYTIAFIIGKDPNLFGPYVGEELYFVLIASTPNPTSGFFYVVPKKEIIFLDISVEDGMKMIISSGMVAPQGPQSLSGQPVNLTAK